MLHRQRKVRFSPPMDGYSRGPQGCLPCTWWLAVVIYQLNGPSIVWTGNMLRYAIKLKTTNTWRHHLTARPTCAKCHGIRHCHAA
ncbi:hypothetical protein BDW66DRAFT_126616 [Aspergillus desertorum]